MNHPLSHQPTLRSMKMLLIILVYFIGFTTVMGDDELLQTLIINVLPEGPQGRIVYVSKGVLPGGSVIDSWMNSHISPHKYEYAWFYFVDDQPEANWEHRCRYVFIDVETGDFQVQHGKTPPDKLSGMIKLYPDE